MAATNEIRGKDLNLYVKVNGFAEPIAHSTNCVITFNADIQETTTLNSLKGKTYDYAGKYGYTLSCDGYSNLIDIANFSTIQLAIMQSNKLSFIFTDENQVQYSGTVLANDTSLDSPFDAISSFKTNFTGDGEIVPIYYAQPVPPVGEFVQIVDQFNAVIADIPAPGTYGVLRFDDIDCGNASTVSPLLIISAA